FVEHDLRHLGEREEYGWTIGRTLNVSQRLHERLTIIGDATLCAPRADGEFVARLFDLAPDSIQQKVSILFQKFRRVALEDQDQVTPISFHYEDVGAFFDQFYDYTLKLTILFVFVLFGAVTQFDLEDCDLIMPGDQIQPQHLTVLHRFHRRDRSNDQFKQQALAKRGVIFVRLFLKLCQLVAFLPFLIQLDGQFLKRVLQGLDGDGFEQVVGHAQFDGLLGVFEFVVSAEDDDLYPRHAFPDDLAQLQSVHERHFDVGDQDVGLGGAQ